MVTFELAVGVLSVVVLAALLGWGVNLVALQARCTDVAGQVARQLARGDESAADEAKALAPVDSVVLVEQDARLVRVSVTVDARWGYFGPVSVTGRASAPAEGR